MLAKSKANFVVGLVVSSSILASAHCRLCAASLVWSPFVRPFNVDNDVAVEKGGRNSGDIVQVHPDNLILFRKIGFYLLAFIAIKMLTVSFTFAMPCIEMDTILKKLLVATCVDDIKP